MEVRIRTQQSSELYLLLERGEIDIAFSLLEQPMPNMIIEKIFSEPLVVIRKENFPQSNQMIDLKELDPEKALYINWHSSFRAWYDRFRGEREYPPIRVDTAQLLQTFMDIPGKWAIVPLSMAKSFEATGEFGLYQLIDPPPDRVCYQIRPRHPRPGAIESLEILDSVIKSTMS